MDDLFEELTLKEIARRGIGNVDDHTQYNAYFKHKYLPLVFGESETSYTQDDVLSQVKAIEEAKNNVIMFVRFENNQGLTVGLLPYWDKEKKRWYIKNEGKRIYE